MPGSRPLQCCALLLVVLGSAAYAALASAASDRPAQINVAYFKHWPAPLQFAQASQTSDRVLGLDVNRLPYRDAEQVTAALAAGDVQIACSLGHVPFLVASYSAELARFFVAHGQLEKSLDSYDRFVSTRFLP
jgi:ABC-type taurine transport system substrate-binding protein